MKRHCVLSENSDSQSISIQLFSDRMEVLGSQHADPISFTESVDIIGERLLEYSHDRG